MFIILIMNSFRREEKEEKGKNQPEIYKESSYQTNMYEKSKGMSALDNLHKNLLKENEKKINLKISDIYGVDSEEAYEIHINYHTTRLLKTIENTQILNDMKDFIQDVFDIKSLSEKVAAGEITEGVCIDYLINLIKNKKETKIKDRYINFYG